MHCVYDAFDHHMRYLNAPVTWAMFDAYKYCKQFTHGSIYEYTFAGIIPWMYTRMLQIYNARSNDKITMQIQLQYVPWKCLLDEAGTGNKQMVMDRNTPYKGEQVDKITLAPAIYCLLNQQHALFATEVPQGKGIRIIMAIRLKKYFIGVNKENGKDEGKIQRRRP